MGKQVADRDRVVGLRQRRQPLADRIVERQALVLRQQQDRRCGELLRHRRQAVVRLPASRRSSPRDWQARKLRRTSGLPWLITSTEAPGTCAVVGAAGCRRRSFAAASSAALAWRSAARSSQKSRRLPGRTSYDECRTTVHSQFRSRLNDKIFVVGAEVRLADPLSPSSSSVSGGFDDSANAATPSCRRARRPSRRDSGCRHCITLPCMSDDFAAAKRTAPSRVHSDTSPNHGSRQTPSQRDIASAVAGFASRDIRGAFARRAGRCARDRIGVFGDVVLFRGRREMLEHHFGQHRARIAALAVRQHDEAAAPVGQQTHYGIHARQRAGMRHIPDAIDVRAGASQAVRVEVAVVPVAAALRDRHRRVRRPQDAALLRREPGQLASRRDRASCAPR